MPIGVQSTRRSTPMRKPCKHLPTITLDSFAPTVVIESSPALVCGWSAGPRISLETWTDAARAEPLDPSTVDYCPRCTLETSPERGHNLSTRRFDSAFNIGGIW